MKRIAVWNTAFLGDAILTLPLIQSIKKAYPDAFLDFYVRAGLEPIFSAHPAIGRVHGVHKKGLSLGATLSLMKTIRKGNYSAWVTAHTSFRSGFVAYRSRAKLKIGYKETPLSFLWFDKRVSRSFEDKDEVERLLELLKALDIEAESSWPEIYLPQKPKLDADVFFKELRKGKNPVLGVHPGSVWPTKRWPAEYFGQIGCQALEKGAEIVVFAGPGEEDMGRAVIDFIKKRTDEDQHKKIHNLSGSLSLTELAAYISKLDLYLTNDSGPMHLAWAQRVPVTALFGPTVKELGFFPRGDKAKVFQINLPCRPCGLHGHKSCPNSHHDCMVKLSPKMVWPDVDAKLEEAAKKYL